jgi:hypothetical protein
VDNHDAKYRNLLLFRRQNSRDSLSLSYVVDVLLAELQLLPQECLQLQGRSLCAERSEGQDENQKECAVPHLQGCVWTPILHVVQGDFKLAMIAARLRNVFQKVQLCRSHSSAHGGPLRLSQPTADAARLCENLCRVSSDKLNFDAVRSGQAGKHVEQCNPSTFAAAVGACDLARTADDPASCALVHRKLMIRGNDKGANRSSLQSSERLISACNGSAVVGHKLIHVGDLALSLVVGHQRFQSASYFCRREAAHVFGYGHDESGRELGEVFLNGIDQAVRSYKEKTCKVVLFGQGK